MKGKHRMGETICNHRSDKMLILKIYEESIQLNNKKNPKQFDFFKKSGGTKKIFFQRHSSGTWKDAQHH